MSGIQIAILICALFEAVVAVCFWVRANELEEHDKAFGNALRALADLLDEEEGTVNEMSERLAVLDHDNSRTIEDLRELRKQLDDLKPALQNEARWNEGLQNIMNYMGSDAGQVKHDE